MIIIVISCISSIYINYIVPIIIIGTKLIVISNTKIILKNKAKSAQKGGGPGSVCPTRDCPVIPATRPS